MRNDSIYQYDRTDCRKVVSLTSVKVRIEHKTCDDMYFFRIQS